MIFKKGDQVYITYNQRTVEGVVVLASENGRSLMLGFATFLGEYVGMMPVLRGESEDSDFEDIIRHRVAVVTPRPCPPRNSD